MFGTAATPTTRAVKPGTQLVINIEKWPDPWAVDHDTRSIPDLGRYHPCSRVSVATPIITN
jgi:hypothetical protein